MPVSLRADAGSMGVHVSYVPGAGWLAPLLEEQVQFAFVEVAEPFVELDGG